MITSIVHGTTLHSFVLESTFTDNGGGIAIPSDDKIVFCVECDLNGDGWTGFDHHST